MDVHAWRDRSGAIIMEPQQSPAKPPIRSRRRTAIIVAAVAAAVVVCLAAPAVYVVEAMLGPSLGELTAVADELSFPSDLTLIEETSTGNRLCLEDCVRLSRIYASPLPVEATVKSVVAVLEKANYQCVVPSHTTVNLDRCDRLVGFVTIWRRGTDQFEVNLTVYPIPSPQTSMYFSSRTVDPAWHSYVALDV